MSRKRIGIAAIIVALTVLLAAVLLRTPIRIWRYDDAFAQVTRGMSESRVVQLMGQPDRVDSHANVAFWNDEGLSQETAADVRRQYWYNVSTFFLPISWTVGFDENGAVISKHRWD